MYEVKHSTQKIINPANVPKKEALVVLTCPVSSTKKDCLDDSSDLQLKHPLVKPSPN